MGVAESTKITELMIEALENHEDEAALDRIRQDVKRLTDAFPLY